MPKLFTRIRKIGLPPGTLEPVVEQKPRPTRMTILDYASDHFEEREVKSIEEIFAFRDTSTVTWINIDGYNVNIIDKIDDYFGIHPLVSEDILNTYQRPKIEDYEDYLFFVLHMIYFNEQKTDIYSEQISLILGKNFVISFQETIGDVFDEVRDRIRTGRGRIRQMGADYLAYCLIDAIVDHYFIILESLGERVDRLEEEIMVDIRREMPREIHRLKRDIVFLRKQMWPLREVINTLHRNGSKLIKKTTQVYLRDVYDNTIHVNDTIDVLREALTGMHDIYLSSVSNKMNEVMKVLTIFAAIFIPLTFIVGVYGMNFENMPELKWKYGYFDLLGVMAFITAGMIVYFKKRKWL